MTKSWIEKEEASLLADSKKKITSKGIDNIILLKFALILFCVFFYSICAEARQAPERTNNPERVQRVEGKTFKCSHCRMNQWQDSKNANWSGRYYCTNCGKEL